MPSSLGVAVSSLGSRLSFGLTVLSEEGVASSGGGEVSRSSCCPLGVASRDSVGVGGGVLASGSILVIDREVGTAATGAWTRVLELCSGSLMPKQRHCMMLVSLPPVDTRCLSLCKKVTLVT